jgi:CubicO group peptidase (beta-lactamase class C family)
MTPIKTIVFGAVFALSSLQIAVVNHAVAEDSALASSSGLHITQDKLDKLLKEHKLPGVSLAVIDNYKVVLRATSGEKRFGSGELIDHDTAFSTASISKPVTALLVAMLEEQGKLCNKHSQT